MPRKRKLIVVKVIGVQATRLPPVMPTPERAQHNGGLELRSGRFYSRKEPLIDRLLKQEKINDYQHSAASRIYRDWMLAGKETWQSMTPDAVRGCAGRETLSERRAEALDEMRAAIASLSNWQWNTVWYLVLAEVGEMRAYEQHYQWRNGTGIDYLCKALDALIIHYKQRERLER